MDTERHGNRSSSEVEVAETGKPDSGSESGTPPDTPGTWVFSGLLGLVAAYALYGSFEYHPDIRRWPLGLSVVILACLAIYAVQQILRVRAFRAKRAAPEPELPADRARNAEYSREATTAAILALSGFSLFLLAAYWFSFMVATAVFVPIYMLVAGVRRPGLIIGVTLGMLIAVWFFFGFVLNAPIETGRALSLDWLVY